MSTSAVFPPWLDEPGVATVTVVYDLIPFLFADHYVADDATRRFLEERRAKVESSDLLLAISDCTSRDIVEHWQVDPASTATIGAPRPREFDTGSADLPVGDEHGSYVLAPVGYEWRKEPSRIIDGWSRVPRSSRRGRRLVLVGEAPDEIRVGWMKFARRRGLRRGEVEIAGRVDDRRLRSLYRGAELVVHGSRYEGFGLPVLEASLCGAASITSDRGALPEVLDCPQSTFDPEDPEAIASTILRTLEGGVGREAVVSAAVRLAGGTDDFFDRLRSALGVLEPIGVWQPPVSVLVVGGDTETADSFETGTRLVTHLTGALIGRPDVVTAAHHDHVVHVLDGGVDDPAVLRWAAAVPGVVICRRSDLAPLWIELALADTADASAATEWLHTVIQRCYRGAHPPEFPARDLMDPMVWSRFGSRGFGALVSASRVVAVGPEVHQRVRFDAGPLLEGRVAVLGPHLSASILDE